MIIWGWRTTQKEMGVIGIYHCNHCGNDGTWKVTKYVSWFTLFFIPIIPYRFRYFVACPICSYGTELTKKQYNELMEKINRNASITQNE